MTILELCEKIELQSEIREKVIAFLEKDDYSKVQPIVEEFKDYNKMQEACGELIKALGEDPDGTKILACNLAAALEVYESLAEKGIDELIFIETMKCYKRFIDETFVMTGKLCYDRFWWTTRQAGGHLFRIGELEYEYKNLPEGKTIELHIPSKCNFSQEIIDESLQMAKAFTKRFKPEFEECGFYCCSWLLDQNLKGMLKPESNIIKFQNRFEIIQVGEPNTEFIEWVFNSKTEDYKSLPENTSLQKNMKKYVLAGGKIGNTYGRLKED